MNCQRINVACCYLFLLMLCLQIVENVAAPVIDANNNIRIKSHNLNSDQNDIDRRSQNNKKLRPKRQFDFLLDADHEDGTGTNVLASASVNLYKSENTRLDGTARYSQRFNDFGAHGKAKVGGSIHLHHD